MKSKKRENREDLGLIDFMPVVLGFGRSTSDWERKKEGMDGRRRWEWDWGPFPVVVVVVVDMVAVPMASPGGVLSTGVVIVVSVPRYRVFCCSTGMGIYWSPFWGGDFGVRVVTRGGALNRLGRREGGAEQ